MTDLGLFARCILKAGYLTGLILVPLVWIAVRVIIENDLKLGGRK